MATNNLISVSPSDLILADHINNINEAISGDVVPRNPFTGNPDGLGGNLGQAGLRWTNVWSFGLDINNIAFSIAPGAVLQIARFAQIYGQLGPNGWTPASLDRRIAGTEGADAGVKNLSISQAVSFTSTGSNQTVTNSDCVITPRLGAALVGLLVSNAASYGVSGAVGGERFRILNTTTSTQLGPTFPVMTTSLPIGCFQTMVTTITGTAGTPQTLRLECLDTGLTLTNVRLFCLEI